MFSVRNVIIEIKYFLKNVEKKEREQLLYFDILFTHKAHKALPCKLCAITFKDKYLGVYINQGILIFRQSLWLSEYLSSSTMITIVQDTFKPKNK